MRSSQVVYTFDEALVDELDSQARLANAALADEDDSVRGHGSGGGFSRARVRGQANVYVYVCVRAGDWRSPKQERSEPTRG